MTDSLVSIIIPVYNMRKRLSKCLNSILNQTYKNLEVIIINDGSIDDSLTICNKYAIKDNRIILVDKINGGVGSARNEGLDLATGDYVMFVDPDDYVALNYVESLLNGLKINNADIAECGYFTENEITGGKTTIFPRFEVMNSNHEINLSWCLNTGLTDYLFNKIYKIELFKDLRFSDLKCSEDFEILCKCLLNVNKVVGVHEILYYYIRNEDSIGMQKFSLKSLDVIKAREKCISFYEQENNFELACATAVQLLSLAISLYSTACMDKSIDSQEGKEYIKQSATRYYSIALKEKNSSLLRKSFRAVKFTVFVMKNRLHKCLWVSLMSPHLKIAKEK